MSCNVAHKGAVFRIPDVTACEGRSKEFRVRKQLHKFDS